MATDFTTLPFVVSTAGVATNLWAVSPSGNWSADNATGAGHADVLADFMAETGDSAILPLIVRQIAKSGDLAGGIEVGFFNRLGALAAMAVQRATSHE